MGLGPSIKMTTLHHFRCPLTEVLSRDEQLEFTGIVVGGVSERFEDKLYTARRVGDMAQLLQADAALVAIDGWGNHHVDFVNVIEQLGLRGIPSVGLSYIAQQGRLVCSNEFVDCVVDFNKSAVGYESCVVGENNLTEDDAKKAVALLKLKLKKYGKYSETRSKSGQEIIRSRLEQKYFAVREVIWGEKTQIKGDSLKIRTGIGHKEVQSEPRIEEIKISILKPGQTHLFVNSNLDFSPIACKVSGEPGKGITHILDHVTLMLTGVEDGSGFQPANIGSSEGLLKNQVVFDRAGTPAASDHLLHVDVKFVKGEGRTVQGIRAAHRIADVIAGEIREELRNIKLPSSREKVCLDLVKPGKPKVILVKIVSGLGNMYDTSMFPEEPGGYIGSRHMMESGNLPYLITPNQCRDGVIHSLL